MNQASATERVNNPNTQRLSGLALRMMTSPTVVTPAAAARVSVASVSTYPCRMLVDSNEPAINALHHALSPIERRPK